jgi:D-3-phosphoglycerate dehydrogenase
MKIAILDDYQDIVRRLPCFAKLQEHVVTIFNDTEKDPQRLAHRLAGIQALVLMRERTAITRELLRRLPDLKLISQTGRGIAHIDLAACTQHRVIVSAANISSPSAPAELTWGLILCAARSIPQEVQRLKEGHWQSTVGLGLRGRTLGIFGFGRIGGLVAEVGRAFGMRILVWGREGSRSRAGSVGFDVASSKHELFRESDVLSLHLTLNEETRGIVGVTDLGLMKSSAILVNTSRAQLIAEGALVDGLRKGRPGFAAVDVYEEEPVLGAQHPLLHAMNAICTPHLGVVERGTYELYFGKAFDQVLAYAAGNPIHILNTEALA